MPSMASNNSTHTAKINQLNGAKTDIIARFHTYRCIRIISAIFFYEFANLCFELLQEAKNREAQESSADSCRQVYLFIFNYYCYLFVM